MDGGDLKDYLEKTDIWSFTWDEKIERALCIVRGLAYVHTKNVIHRDLKSRNVLLDSVSGTKLADFGISREVNNETMTVGVGTYRWTAPEMLKGSQYDIKSDIFSFGMILSELDSHQIPYWDMRDAFGHPLVDTAIMSLVMHGKIHVKFSATCPKMIRKLAKKCTATDPSCRPTACEVEKYLVACQISTKIAQ